MFFCAALSRESRAWRQNKCDIYTLALLIHNNKHCINPYRKLSDWNGCSLRNGFSQHNLSGSMRLHSVWYNATTPVLRHRWRGSQLIIANLLKACSVVSSSCLADWQLALACCSCPDCCLCLPFFMFSCQSRLCAFGVGTNGFGGQW